MLVAGDDPAINNRPGHAALLAPGFKDLVGRQCAQFLQRRGARRFGELRTRRLGIGEHAHVLSRRRVLTHRTERSAALRDSADEEPLGKRRGAQHADGNAARRFTEDRDALGVASERGDVLLNPPEPGDHVEQTVVAGDVLSGFGAEFRMRVEAEDPHAVGDANQGHAAFG